MITPDLNALLSLALSAAEKASAEILKIYSADDLGVESKADNSPLTLADRHANQVIVETLKASGLPVLSEEGSATPYQQRSSWDYYWLVDPLDGTKEFIKRNGEFTVNIALVHQGVPVLGVVQVPVTSEVYFGIIGGGAFVRRAQETKSMGKRGRTDLKRPGLKVVASRSHMNEETTRFIGSLRDPVLISSGSSLKFMLVAEGMADVYPRFAPTMEWDTAAAQAIVTEVGLVVKRTDSDKILTYNKESLVNPYFIVL